MHQRRGAFAFRLPLDDRLDEKPAMAKTVSK